MKFFRNIGIWIWAVGYLCVIFAFAVIYYILPEASWNEYGKLDSFVDSLYFSVVTITSLGFGDIFPKDSSVAKLFVGLESITGILVIGFFLNDIALRQSARIDDLNKIAEEKKKYDSALQSLKTYQQILRPVLERYLRGIYMMVTPLDKKLDMPQDIIHYDFNFEYKDLGNMYEQTILMSSDHYVPSINAHFMNQEITFNELRYFVTNADLSYWPRLKKDIYDFISAHHQFQFQDVIINADKRVMGDGGKLSTFVAEHISKTDVMPKFESGNIFSPYVALYHFTKMNVVLVKDIYGLLEETVV